jgi:hypothetical protein
MYHQPILYLFYSLSCFWCYILYGMYSSTSLAVHRVGWKSGKKLVNLWTLTDKTNRQSARKWMQTRQAKHAFVCEHFHLKALPWLYHENVITAVCEVLLESNMTKSEFCRLIFSTQGSRFSQNSHRHRLQKFLDVARSRVSRCKAQAEKDRTTEARRQVGALHFCSPRTSRSFGTGWNGELPLATGQHWEKWKSK